MFKPDGETPIRRMIESVLNDNEDSRLLLRLAGIRIVSDFATNEGFVVASSGPGVNRLFDGSAWEKVCTGMPCHHCLELG